MAQVRRCSVACSDSPIHLPANHTDATMDDDTEVLDWGNEDDEIQGPDTYRSYRSSGDGPDNWRDPEEAEDVVSLGGDEDDMQNFYAYKSSEEDASRGQSSASKPTSQSGGQKRDQRDFSSHMPSSSQTSDSASTLRRSQSFGKMTHALPPKPVLVASTYIPPSPVQMSTLASAMVPREKKANGHGKSGRSLDGDILPPDWEVRYSRGDSREKYFYNVKTHESTWTQPGSVSAGGSSPSKGRDVVTTEAQDARSPRRGEFDESDPADLSEKDTSSRAGRRTRALSPNNATTSLSYEDRHYRPTDASNSGDHVAASGRRELGDFYRPGPQTDTTPSSRMHNERHRSRSLSPRRDDRFSERAVRGGRDVPPAPPANNATWKETREEVTQDRRNSAGWGRQRAASNANAGRGRTPETRISAHYESMELDISSQYESKPKDKPARQRPDEWSTSSTLFASSHPSRDSRLCSFRGGGRMFCDCLEKPWELSFAALSFLLSSTASPDHGQDAHHGSLLFCPVPFILRSLPFISFSLLHLQETGLLRLPLATRRRMRVVVLCGGDHP